MGFLNRLLEHPLTAGLSVDDPRTTLLRRDIIKQKPFLSLLYEEWYARILNALPERKRVLELGSGAGFMAEYCPDLITSEILETPGVRIVADACQLPFQNDSLDAIVMADVLHHIPNVENFFREAIRCIHPGGKIVMIEPWKTSWSSWIYTHLHSEPFLPEAGWTIPSTGPLSGANGALPWIVFERDRSAFEAMFPEWQINRIEPTMPLAYLLSGGVSMRGFMPGWMYRPIRRLEKLYPESAWAMFALIELERKE